MSTYEQIEKMDVMMMMTTTSLQCFEIDPEVGNPEGILFTVRILIIVSILINVSAIIIVRILILIIFNCSDVGGASGKAINSLIDQHSE